MMSFAQTRTHRPPARAPRLTNWSADRPVLRANGANRARTRRSFQTMGWCIVVILGLHCRMQASAQPADPPNGRILTAQIRVCLENYVRQGHFGGFYDFENPSSEPLYTRLEPARLELPADSWPLDRTTGF